MNNEVREEIKTFLTIRGKVTVGFTVLIAIGVAIGVAIKTSTTAAIITIAVCIVINAILAFFASVTIMKPLRKIKALADRMSKYDITTDIEITRSDEFGIIGMALNKAQGNLRELIKVCVKNAANVSALSEEASATVQELSANIEEINSEFEKIDSNTQANSGNVEEI